MAEAKENKTEKKPVKKADNAQKKGLSFLEYKGKPLVRSGDTIYYGNMSDPYVICINIISSSEKNGVKLSEKVAIQLLDTDPNTPMKDKVIKKSEKQGLYNALDLGAIWLERALKNKE